MADNKSQQPNSESKANIGYKLMLKQVLRCIYISIHATSSSGWSPGQGLGPHGEGMTDNVQALYRPDRRGIGSPGIVIPATPTEIRELHMTKREERLQNEADKKLKALETKEKEQIQEWEKSFRMYWDS